MSVKLFKGDCLELMKQIEDESIDMILADLPFGVTNNDWDSVIPLKPLFKQYERIIKPHGAILLFGQIKFGVQLINNAPKKLPFRYEWIWQKTHPNGFLLAHQMPMKDHESIYVFYKHLPSYNPQMRSGFKPYTGKSRSKNKPSTNYGNSYAGYRQKGQLDGKRFPIDVIKFGNADNTNRVHPTQKPVDLLQYLIKTYTDEGMTVLDNTMGSGSTGVAAVSLNRNFIGMELDEDYFKIAKERIKKASSAS